MEITSALTFNRVQHDCLWLSIVSQITGHHLPRIRVFLSAFSPRLTGNEGIDYGGVFGLKR